MKKTKKLALNRETLRALESNEDLRLIAGRTCWSTESDCPDMPWCQDQQNQSGGC